MTNIGECDRPEPCHVGLNLHFVSLRTDHYIAIDIMSEGALWHQDSGGGGDPDPRRALRRGRQRGRAALYPAQPCGHV